MSRKKDPLKEIKTFWGDVVKNEEFSIQHRLKASELLVKVGEDDSGEGGVGVIIIEGENQL